MWLNMNLNPRIIIKRLFPIVQWSREYTCGTSVCDLIAGITVALTLIPQSIAYSSLAGLQPQFGLYASLVGSIVYSIFGSCPQINIGPTALLSLLTFTYTNGTNPDFAILLCFISGVIILIAGILQLGFLINYISLPVISGFTSAAALTVATSQIKGLLGLKFKADSFMSTWIEIYKHITEIKMSDTLLSLGCISVIFGMKVLSGRTTNQNTTKVSKLLQRVVWLSGVARNTIVVIMATVIAYLMQGDHQNPFEITGNITSGLPTPSVPLFNTKVGNITFSTSDMFTHLGSGLVVVPIVSIIANVAIAKAFANGKTVDATQEIIALGFCSLIGSFFKSYPVNGSFSRSAVSQASGVRTPAAGLYTAFLVIVTLILLTPYFFFIPKSALASVIICAVLLMVDIKIITRLWYLNRRDLISLLTTFIVCVGVGIEIGLACGILMDIIIMLYYHSKPGVVFNIEESNLKEYEPGARQLANSNEALTTMCLYGAIHFPCADKIQSHITSLNSSTLYIDCNGLNHIDYTCLQAIKSSVGNRKIILYSASKDIFDKFELLFGPQLMSMYDKTKNTQHLNRITQHCMNDVDTTRI